MTLTALLGAQAVLVACVMSLQNHFVCYGFMAALPIHLRRRPRWGEVAAIPTLAALLTLIRIRIVGSQDLFVSVLPTCALFLGISSFFLIAFPIPWSSDPERRQRIVDLLVPAGIAVFTSMVGAMLWFTARFHPFTFDSYLYDFDGRLGFQPSFALGRVLVDWPWLRIASAAGYESLPFMIAVFYAGQEPAKACRALLTLFTAGVSAAVLYHVVPATGPLFLFPKQFPFAAPAASGAKMVLIDPAFGRNCVPSMHVAWTLLMFWAARRCALWLRALTGAILALTVVATLGFGQHYLVDLVIAVPFALGVRAASTGTVAGRTNGWRLPFAAGAVMTLGWLVLLRVGDPSRLPCAAAWVLVISTVVSSLLLERAFSKRAECEYRLSSVQASAPSGRWEAIEG